MDKKVLNESEEYTNIEIEYIRIRDTLEGATEIGRQYIIEGMFKVLDQMCDLAEQKSNLEYIYSESKRFRFHSIKKKANKKLKKIK